MFFKQRENCIKSWQISVCDLAFVLHLLKGTVNVISSDSAGEDANVRFTTVPLKALSDQV